MSSSIMCLIGSHGYSFARRIYHKLADCVTYAQFCFDGVAAFFFLVCFLSFCVLDARETIPCSLPSHIHSRLT